MKRSIFIFLFLVTIEGYAQFAPVPSFFRTQRAMPLVSLNTTSTINVSDYGAVVNDGNDDLIAINNALDAAKNIATAQNPVRLVFESGTYDIMYSGSFTHAIELRDVNGLLWDGQNAEFLIHNPTVGFLALLRCENTILQDFSIDHATLPFSQGIVTNINLVDGYFEFQLDDFSPVPTTASFMNAPQRWGMFKNSKGGIKEGTKNLIPHNQFFELIGTRTYRYGAQNANTLQNAAVGDYFVHIGRYNGSTLIRNNEGKNVTYMNITGYASASGGFNSRNCEEWNVINCHIKLKEGRVHSVNADAMHTNGNFIGPWVENCSFEGFSDDFMNIKYARRAIKTIHSSTEITVQSPVNVGEKMEFYNPRDGVLIGTATITNVVAQGGNLFRLTLSEAVNITTINPEDDQLADKAYLESRSNESFIFRNNIVRNSRRYGILIQSKYALIENNLFQNLSGAGIRIENGVDWTEGFRAHEIEIRNNRFENCGYDKNYIEEGNSAAISVDFAKVATPCTPNGGFCGTETTNYRAHSNIRIIDNTILYNKRGMYLKNIEGLTLDNNFICHREEDITLQSGQMPEDEVILNSTNVSNVPSQIATPDANIQFILNEPPSAMQIVNSGTNQDVGLQINTSGGTITQGHVDGDIGYSFNINTNNNGDISFINTSNSSPFPGPLQGAARTYSFWVKPSQEIFQTFMFSGTGSEDGEILAIQMQSNRRVRVTDTRGNFVRMDDLPLDIGQWNHIAITIPENNTLFTTQMYKNGVASEEYHQGEDVFVKTGSSALRFFPNYTGVASDIRYFDYKLCGSQIESVYNDRQITLSVKDELSTADNTIKVYPTMASNTIYFDKEVHTIRIVNLLGKTLISKNKVRLKELDISSLSSGLYLIRINDHQTTKFFKN
ncbi:putative secreted protein (Por secretion system target) [Kordia periserrulae]|uniref:Putative secreted protein (Por secretion system target) n=2 Tax=Kordia periserrulae TaxID=701523 RepID=A0A2T6BUD1_9FLAO|nr:putative secreted protein (Por secretion system target) [Kordia periserrulae]